MLGTVDAARPPNDVVEHSHRLAQVLSRCAIVFVDRKMFKFSIPSMLRGTGMLLLLTLYIEFSDANRGRDEHIAPLLSARC